MAFIVSFCMRRRDNSGEGWYLCKPPMDSCIPLPARDTGYGIRDTGYWLRKKRFSMLLKKSLYFFNKLLSLYQQGIMAERKKIFYAKKNA